jgi:hypothetical protein
MAWDVEQALEMIEELRSVGIRSFEQPIAAGDLAGLARLVRESSAGIVVDEGLSDRESLQALITYQWSWAGGPPRRMKMWLGRPATSASPGAAEPDYQWDAGASGTPDCCCEHAT